MRNTLLASLLAAAFALPLTAHAAAAKPAAAKPAAAAKQEVKIEMKVRDMGASFLEFLDEASKPAAAVTPPAQPEAEADRRWRLFKKLYDFSVQQDPAQARAALEAAWPRYAAIKPLVEAGFDGIATEPSTMVNTMAAQVFLDKPLSLRFISYVGAFEGKVWSEQDGDTTNIYLPLEVDAKTRALPLARILARMMLEKSAAWGKQPRNLAELAVAEGVVAKLVQSVVPGQPQEAYFDLNGEQFGKARANSKADYKAIAYKLAENGAVLNQYSGEQLAATRLAGWAMVEAMAKKKGRIADMIRQNPAELAKVNQTLLLKASFK